MDKNIKIEIQKIIQEILKETFKVDISMSHIQVEEPKKKEHGDYTTNIALQIGKRIEIIPIDLAKQLEIELKKREELFEDIDVVNPGFINFFIKFRVFWKSLDSMKEDHFIQKHLKEFHRKQLNDQKIKSIQYVHSRICSIIQIFEDEGVFIKEVEFDEPSDFEKILVKKIMDYRNIVEKPEEMIGYIIEITNLFYKLQERTLFRELEGNRLYVILKIIDCMRWMIKEVLIAICIEAPEKM